MKKAILIIIAFAMLNCEFRISKPEISGNWYSCAKNGDYVEMHTKGNKYKYSTDFGNPTNWNEFEIKSDTLIQNDKFVFEDSTIVNVARFQFTQNGDLELEYLTSNEKWTFKKIESKILNVEDDLALKKGTIERSKNTKCIDQRTNEERKKDSLEMQIDFKF